MQWFIFVNATCQVTKIKIKNKILLSCRFVTLFSGGHGNTIPIHQDMFKCEVNHFLFSNSAEDHYASTCQGTRVDIWKCFGVTWENMFTVRIMDLHSVLAIKPLNGSFFPFFVAYAILICSSRCFITVRMDTAYHIMTTVILSWNTLPRFFVEILLRHGMDRFLIAPHFIRHGWWQICTFPVLSHHF